MAEKKAVKAKKTDVLSSDMEHGRGQRRRIYNKRYYSSSNSDGDLEDDTVDAYPEPPEMLYKTTKPIHSQKSDFRETPRIEPPEMPYKTTPKPMHSQQSDLHEQSTSNKRPDQSTKTNKDDGMILMFLFLVRLL